MDSGKQGGREMKNLLVVSLGLLVLVLVGIYFLFPDTLFKLTVQAGRYYAGLVKKEIQVDDHKIVYLEGGKGQTVLLLHGFGVNKDTWIQFAKHLTGDYHVVIPDIPGFGESSQIQNESYAAENQLTRIDRFMAALKIGRFHVAGNSMGGMLAGMYSAKYPQKVLTVGLLAPGGVSSPNPSEVLILLRRGINPLLTNNTEDFDRFIKLCFTKPPFIPSQFKKVLVADAIAHRKFNKKIWNEMVGNVTKETSASKENLLEPYLPKIEAPVLIIWGDADKILDVGGVSILEQNLKNHKTVIMQDTGHAPMLEKSNETASYYVNYLKGKGGPP